MPRILFATLLAAACAAPPFPHVGPQAGSKRIAFNILEDWDKSDDLAEVEKDFELFHELGVTTWRGSFSWLQLEPERGRYDFEWLHQFADLAAKHNITLRPYIAYTPAWAAGAPAGTESWNQPPRSLDDWAAFVKTLAAAMRRHPNIISYEIYNEENARQWWAGSARRYAQTLERAAAAIHGVDPGIQVLLGGMVFPDVEWIRSVCADAAARRSLAIVPFHAYPETWTPDGVTVENYLGPRFETGFVRAVDSSCGARPVWVNETGFATVEGRTEHDQAEWWARAISTFAAEPRVEEIGVYEIKDLRQEHAAIGGTPNYHLGITSSNRTKKLAFDTIRRLVSLFAAAPVTVADGALTVRIRGEVDRQMIFAHAFLRPDGSQIVFVWAKQRATVDVTLPRRGSRAIEYRLDGRPDPPQAIDDGRLESVDLMAGDVRVFEIEP